jgi:hypothetical protein
MFLNVLHVQRINAGAGVVFATGTPIANSVAEMFTMQRYLQMSALKALKLDHFDSWAATFGEPVTAMELAPDGSGYRLNTRFARFINVPELMQQFRQVAEALRTGRIDPRLDNMLLVTTDGRKAALDLRLHDPALPDHPDSKVNQAAARGPHPAPGQYPSRSADLSLRHRAVFRCLYVADPLSSQVEGTKLQILDKLQDITDSVEIVAREIARQIKRDR